MTLPSSRFALKDTVGLKSPPLGLAYIAAVAQKAGEEVLIIDSPTLGFTNEEVVSEIKHLRPHLLGLSATTFNVKETLHIISQSKVALPNLFTVIGGPHVSFTDEETLQECPELDAVVRGEGEETFRELLETVSSDGDLSGVLGLTYRRDEKVFRNPSRPFIKDLDSIPFPAFHLLPMERYFVLSGRRFACMVTSRGCPFGCNFCSSSQLFGKVWRFRSLESVVAEMEMLKSRHGVQEIEFLDDTFTINRKRAAAICERIIARKLNIEWTASARVACLDVDLAREMKEAGCFARYIGFESGSQEVLDSISKGIRVEQVEETMEVTRKAGLETIGSFIIGSLADTVSTIRKTIHFAKRLAPNYAQFTLLTPYPGTPLFEKAKAKGLLAETDWSKFTIVNPVLKHPTISAQKLLRYLHWAYTSFYLRPAFLLQEIKKRNFYILPRAIKAAIRYCFPWRYEKRSKRPSRKRYRKASGVPLG